MAVQLPTSTSFIRFRFSFLTGHANVHIFVDSRNSANRDAPRNSANHHSMSNADSDSEQTQGSENTGVDKQAPSSWSTCQDSNAETVSQQVINLQIFSQLGNISE